MRPQNHDEEEGDVIVQKVSTDSVTINGQTFTFDAVADAEASQVLVAHLKQLVIHLYLRNGLKHQFAFCYCSSIFLSL